MLKEWLCYAIKISSLSCGCIKHLHKPTMPCIEEWKLTFLVGQHTARASISLKAQSGKRFWRWCSNVQVLHGLLCSSQQEVIITFVSSACYTIRGAFEISGGFDAAGSIGSTAGNLTPSCFLRLSLFSLFHLSFTRQHCDYEHETLVDVWLSSPVFLRITCASSSP